MKENTPEQAGVAQDVEHNDMLTVNVCDDVDLGSSRQQTDSAYVH